MKKIGIILLLSIAAVSMGFFRWWEDITVECGTDITAMTFGVDSLATDGYDPYIDVPFFPSPSGGYGYFPIDDSLHPGYSMLSIDYRFPSADEIVWDLSLAGGVGFVVRWEPDDLPDSGDYYIGAYDADSLPDLVVDEWLDMRSADSMAILVLGGRIRAVGSPIYGVAEARRPVAPSISISPNPFNARVSVEFDPPICGRVQIFDIDGRPIIESKIVGANWLWQPDESIGSGIYFMRIFGEGFSATKRLIFLK